MSRLLRSVLVFLLAAGALALVPPGDATAATTKAVTGLAARAGYNSIHLTWNGPHDARYRGVSIWRYAGYDETSPAVLLATLDQTATTYTDSGLSQSPSSVWSYRVYTLDSVNGGVLPQVVTTGLARAMSGRVTDAQGNGVANVQVIVGSSSWSNEVTTRTAVDGAWFVDGLHGPDAVACFDPSDATGGTSTTGYLTQCYPNVPSLPMYGPPGRAVSLTRDGSLVEHIDAVLQTGGVVSGVISDQRGRPLANAGVDVSQRDGHVFRRVVTGADGRYRLTGLVPGQYQGCAYQPPLGVPVTPASATGYLEVCSGGAIDGTSQTYPVVAGANTTSNIELVAAGGISGRLLGPDGQPVVGEPPQLEGPASPDGRYTLTDATGAYRITGLLPGRYTVCFRGSGSSGIGATFDPGRSPRCWKNADASSPTPIEVSTGAWSKSISVKEPANSTVAGRVSDAAGKPIENVAVTVDGFDGVTSSDGTYRVGVTPGTHTVCFLARDAGGASRSGYVDQCWRAPGSNGDGPTPVGVAAGRAVTGIDATLAVAPGLLISVVDAHGVPLRAANIYATPATGGGASDSGVTGATGVVLLKRMSSTGDHVVALDMNNAYHPVPYAALGYLPSPIHVLVKPGVTSVRLVVRSNGVMSGTVYGPGGQALFGAAVTISGPASVTSASTDVDGSYSSGAIAPGTYTVCFAGWTNDVSGARRRVAGCYDRTAAGSATPVVVADGAAVAAIDGHLTYS